MLHAAAERGWVDLQRCALESLTSIKRAGADMIITYFAKDAASWLTLGVEPVERFLRACRRLPDRYDAHLANAPGRPLHARVSRIAPFVPDSGHHKDS